MGSEPFPDENCYDAQASAASESAEESAGLRSREMQVDRSIDQRLWSRSFLSKNGGASNAMTDCEHTLYHFEARDGDTLFGM